jgi:hypothetical protein
MRMGSSMMIVRKAWALASRVMRRSVARSIHLDDILQAT